jgi:hypothetical protein
MPSASDPASIRHIAFIGPDGQHIVGPLLGPGAAATMAREEAMASAKRSTAAASRLGVQPHAFLGAVLAGGTPCAATRKCCRTLSAVDCSSTRAKYPGGYSKVAQFAASDTRAQGPYIPIRHIQIYCGGRVCNISVHAESVSIVFHETQKGLSSSSVGVVLTASQQHRSRASDASCFCCYRHDYYISSLYTDHDYC